MPFFYMLSICQYKDPSELIKYFENVSPTSFTYLPLLMLAPVRIFSSPWLRGSKYRFCHEPNYVK